MMARKNIFQKLVQHCKDVVSLKRSAHSIALGFSIGTAISIIPLFGLSIVMGLLIVFVFKNINKFALFGALALWNPIVLFPLYALGYEIGDIVLGQAPVIEYEVKYLHILYHVTRRLILGNVILAIFVSPLSYYIMYNLVLSWRKRQV